LYSLLACSGASYFGYTSAMIGGCIELPSFQRTFSLSLNTNTIPSNILSFIYIGTLPGSLFILPLSNVLGPLHSLSISSLVYIVGCLLQLFSNGSIPLLYTGRILSGLGMGASVSIAPMYISEISPSAVRGRLVGLHEISFQLTAVLGFWINYGTKRGISDDNAAQWMVPMGLQLVPAATLLLSALFLLPQSPRFLVRRGAHDLALQTLSHIRQLPPTHPSVATELSEIVTDHHNIMSRLHNNSEPAPRWLPGALRPLHTLFTVPPYPSLLLLGSLMMLFFDFTGTIALLAYSPRIYRGLGFSSDTPLLLTGVFGACKGLSSILSSFFLIDRWGRRPLLIWGPVGCSLTMFYIGGYQLLSASQTPTATATHEADLTPPRILALVATYLFAAFFCLSSQVPWIYCAEIFPTHLRTLGVCITTAVQFGAELIQAKAVPYMLSTMGRGGGGAFLFHGACAATMVAWVFCCVPETKEVSLEEMQGRFRGGS
ncbi:general substrate transporter, partial [Kalaharituber pfeilii]